MQPLKAHVKNGKLVLDDPSTDLPEGEVVYLHIADVDDDGLTDEQREALHRSLKRGITQSKAGEGVGGEEFLARLREKRA